MTGEDHNIGRLVAGRYRLDALLGRGGFGSVYRGWDTQIGRDIAVKLLNVGSESRSRAQEAELRERFRREAMAAGRINHPCVVTVFDFGVPDDGNQAYLVMELLDGHDLAEELTTRGPLHPVRALRLFVQLLDALGRGHTMGIVHKDIKPQNIFVRNPGTAAESLCLVDFGVARVVHEDKLTLTGLIVGTPQYMAPEYITDTQVSPALDVYQMGLLLAESITGVPAVPLGESFVKSCNRHFTGDLDIPEDLLDGDFGVVMRKALAPSPNQRYENGAEFCAALATVDASRISMEMQKTTVFQRSARPPTFDEPPLYPPMRPDEASAELERLAREPATTEENAAPPREVPTETSQPAIRLGASPRPALAVTAPAAVISPAPSAAPSAAPAAPVARLHLGSEGPTGGIPATNLPRDQWEWSPEPVAPLTPAPSVPEARGNRGLVLAFAAVAVVVLTGTAFLAIQILDEPAATTSAPPTVTETTPRVPTANAITTKPILVMQIDSEPSGADVVIDGAVVGKTPFNFDVEDHADATIQIRREGFEPHDLAVAAGTKSVTLVAKAPARPKAKRKQAKREKTPALSDEKLRALIGAAEGANDKPDEAPQTPEPSNVVEEEKPASPSRWDSPPPPRVMN